MTRPTRYTLERRADNMSWQIIDAGEIPEPLLLRAASMPDRYVRVTKFQIIFERNNPSVVLLKDECPITHERCTALVKCARSGCVREYQIIANEPCEVIS